MCYLLRADLGLQVAMRDPGDRDPDACKSGKRPAPAMSDLTLPRDRFPTPPRGPASVRKRTPAPKRTPLARVDRNGGTSPANGIFASPKPWMWGSPSETMLASGGGLVDLRSSEQLQSNPTPQRSVRGVLSQELQAVLISGTMIVGHLEGERPFTLYQLHAPLLSGEHVAFRRFSDFLALDASLRRLLDGPPLLPGLPPSVRLTWCAPSQLPPLPSKTLPWQEATSREIVTARWGALQIYLDAVVERIGQCPEAWECFRDFLCLP